jgi:hypothetical protein
MKTLLYCLIFIALSANCFAALGSDVNVIESEHSKLGSSPVQVTNTDKYSVHTMVSPMNTVNEYANNAGKVFAVTWRGNNPPDMTVILGQHLKEFQAQRKATPKSHGRQPFKLKTKNIIVRHWGHMRDLHGIAYRPDLVPVGVNAEVLP